MTKREVLQFLGKSKRTIETYIANGRLPVAYINGPNGKTAIFDRAAVEAFKTQMDAPMQHARSTALVPVRAGVALAPIPPAIDSATFTAAIREAVMSTRVKPWLSIDEAAAFSGLPKSWLRRKAPSGMYGAVNVGTEERERWMFSRNALRG